MMKRISHDLPGTTTRIAQNTSVYLQAAEETAELWKDRKSQAFFQKHTSEIGPTTGQLVSSLAQLQELMSQIAKQVADPDHT